MNLILANIKNFSHNQIQSKFLATIIVTSFIYFFSPLLAWLIVLLVLGLLSEGSTESIRRILGFLLIVAMATITASRKFGISESDDFSRSYYPVFVSIANGDLNSLFSYGKGGSEFGIPVLWYLISIFRPQASSTELIFWTSFISAGIFWVWLEVYGVQKFENKDKATIIAISLLMYSFFLSSQLVRQFFSSTILLFAISSVTAKKRFIFLIVASSFHLTAIPVYIFVQLAKRPRIALWIFLPLGFLFVLGVNELIDFTVRHQHIPGVEKAMYVLYNTKPFSESDLNAGKYLVLVSFFALLSLFSSRRDEGEERKECLSLLLSTLFFYCIFLLIPQFSLRSTLLVNQVLLGWLFAKIINPISWRFVRIFFLIVLVYKTVGLMSLTSSGDMGFWGQFHYWGRFPGYFLIGE